MGIFDQINFNVAASPDSSRDLRLLDTPCDHRIRDESVDLDVTPILTNTPFSGTSVRYNSSNLSGGIDESATITVKTVYPFINDGDTTFYQNANTSFLEPLKETFIVPDPFNTLVSLTYPPQTNSVSAKEKVLEDNGDFVLKPFTRYNLFQLTGQIEFTNQNDVGKEIIFSYVTANKRILQKNKDNSFNYKFEGLDSQSKGIFTFYGRAFLSTSPSVFIRYKTIQDRCPKCSGKGVLNDVLFNDHGRLQEVFDFSKLIQDFFKRLLTEKGSNVFNLQEGTEMAKLSGMAKADGLTLDALVKSEVVNLLYAIRGKQGTQKDIQGLSLAEQIQQINRIDVRATNATTIEVQIEVMSKSGQIEQISSQIRRT